MNLDSISPSQNANTLLKPMDASGSLKGMRSEPLILDVQYAVLCPPKPFKLFLPSYTQALRLSFGNAETGLTLSQFRLLWNESEISKDCHNAE